MYDALVELFVAIKEWLNGILKVYGALEGFKGEVTQLPKFVILEVLPSGDYGVGEGVVEFICSIEELEKLVELMIWLRDGLEVGYDSGGEV